MLRGRSSSDRAVLTVLARRSSTPRTARPAAAVCTTLSTWASTNIIGQPVPELVPPAGGRMQFCAPLLAIVVFSAGFCVAGLGATSSRTAPPAETRAGAAVERALPLLQSSAHTWFEKRQSPSLPSSGNRHRVGDACAPARLPHRSRAARSPGPPHDVVSNQARAALIEQRSRARD